MLISRIPLCIFCYGHLLFFAPTWAKVSESRQEKTIWSDPRQELDILSSHIMHNRHQCQRLCWYRKPCVRYSFYTKNDNPRDNCVLHLRQQKAPDLMDGWFDEEASGHHLSRHHGCSSRPCGQHEVCIPVYGNNKFLCANMSSGAWLGQNCSITCNAPPSAGKTGCFREQCLCAAGYFYSVSQRACVKDCKELANSYLRYQSYDLADSNEGVTKTMDVAECKQKCNADPKCLVFVYHLKLQNCFFKYITALTDPKAWQTKTVTDTYQRTCA